MTKSGRATALFLLLTTMPALAQSGHVFELSNGQVVEATSTERIAPTAQNMRDGQAASKANGRAYFENCAAAWHAGVAPIYLGSPGYRVELDGDRDGIACEPIYKR